jgi:hypothetical protein
MESRQCYVAVTDWGLLTDWPVANKRTERNVDGSDHGFLTYCVFAFFKIDLLLWNVQVFTWIFH